MKKLDLIAMVQRCIDMRVAMISESDAVGKPLDQVIANLQSRGISCGQEWAGASDITSA